MKPWVEKVFPAAPAVRRLGRAGLEALPLRARKFFDICNPENAQIPWHNEHLTLNLKLRLKATFDFSTFQTPLRA